ncbi:hypothetical protein TIFTF001_012770 [Ficus carica]|uniref:Agenet domain-containing protein n=1 Tax=Ficus carica TaxID=3494 RepID=A0AA88D3Z8_FICCA|nr:hypothetical protein TIFTF001_012770 [Ficus carica]
MSFRRNETVEVCQKQAAGFMADGCYLQATFMATIGGTHCLVQYQTRYSDDSKKTLKSEVVHADVVRPVPPSPSNRTDYAVSQKVDAYDGGGWWVGRISAVEGDADAPEFTVRLDATGNRFKFPFFRLRNHLDWRGGEWVQPAPSRA